MDPIDLTTIFSARPRNSRKPRDWYEIKNLGGVAEVFLYDFIGFDPWFGGVSAAQFVQDLRGINAGKILVRVNSPGGIVDEAIAIKTALDEHPATIETHIDGIAASAASWVALGADKVIIAPHARMMIHEPDMVCFGAAGALRKAADMLDGYAQDIAAMYVEKAGGDAAQWRDQMLAETWFTDQEAVDAGLADAIAGEAADAAQNRYEPAFLSIYKHVPADLLPAKNRQTKKATTPAPVAPSDQLVKAALEFQRNESRRLGVAV